MCIKIQYGFQLKKKLSEISRDVVKVETSILCMYFIRIYIYVFSLYNFLEKFYNRHKQTWIRFKSYISTYSTNFYPKDSEG